MSLPLHTITATFYGIKVYPFPSASLVIVLIAWLQDLLTSSGRKHSGLIVRWWMSGVLFGWCLGLILSLAMSPVLGFLVLIPLEAISLLFGYASSAVEMKVRRGDSILWWWRRVDWTIIQSYSQTVLPLNAFYHMMTHIVGLILVIMWSD